MSGAPTQDGRRRAIAVDMSRFRPEEHGTPDEPRPDHRFPRWWWQRLELSSNTHRSFGHVAPTTRGWLHLAMAFVWPVLVARLYGLAEPGQARWGVLVFGVGIQAMFSASALTHLRRWDVWTTELLFRLDHTGIFLAIGGSTTPIAMLTLDGWRQAAVLLLIWGVALVGTTTALYPGETPVGFGNTAFIGGSALVVPFVPTIAASLGLWGTVLLVSGGATYIVGATLLAFQKPRLSPSFFGYHEFWHAMVVAGVMQHYLVVERYALPLA